jgi:flagellar capping protein FliD
VLASDTIFSDLRSNLFGSLVSETAVSGAYKSLRQIGIGLTENLSLTISDSARLEDVLNENLDDVSALFDQVMGQVDAHLERFTAVGTGYLDTRVTSTDSALRTLGTDIVRMEETLDDREGFLVLQYSKLQAELASLSYLQQQFKSIYG